MIEVKVNKGRTELNLEGNTADLIAETMMILRTIYRGIAEKNLRAADMFARMVITTIDDGDMTPFKLDEEEDAT